MYHVSAQGIDERMINVHYYYNYRVNFSLCLIIPQSFQFVGQIVRLSCFLQSVFQMIFLGLQACLQTAHKIVNDTHTFLYPWSWL